MQVIIDKPGDYFEVYEKGLCGAYPVGRGRTMEAAMACFLRVYQKELGIVFEVTDQAWPAELRRRTRELGKR